jgi:copper oxidase (laccase) domain-containing protein
MDVLRTDIKELWLVQSRDCAQEPVDLSDDRARFIVAVHAGHGARCHQYLAASAHCYRRTAEK